MIRWVFCVLVFSCIAVAQSHPKLVTKVDAASIFPFDFRNSIQHVVFIADDRIAISSCTYSGPTHCEVQVLKLHGTALQRIGRSEVFDSSWRIHRTTGDRLLATGFPGRPGRLFSADLKQSSEIPDFNSSLVSLSGKTFIHYEGHEKWTLYSINEEVIKVRDGTGQPDSVSDQAVLVEQGKTLRLEKLDGTLVSPIRRWAILLDNPSITPASKLPIPKGCCGAFAGSDDNSRILADEFERRETFWQSLGDFIPDDNTPANIENIRVFETATGKICFDYRHWIGKEGIGQGQPHGDISPSGKKVIVWQDEYLLIYELPLQCGTATLIE
jgi:hypothetical protein